MSWKVVPWCSWHPIAVNHLLEIAVKCIADSQTAYFRSTLASHAQFCKLDVPSVANNIPSTSIRTYVSHKGFQPMWRNVIDIALVLIETKEKSFALVHQSAMFASEIQFYRNYTSILEVSLHMTLGYSMSFIFARIWTPVFLWCVYCVLFWFKFSVAHNLGIPIPPMSLYMAKACKFVAPLSPFQWMEVVIPSSRMSLLTGIWLVPVVFTCNKASAPECFILLLLAQLMNSN